MSVVSTIPHMRPDAGLLAELCRRYHVLRLSFFGSVIRPDYSPLSDIDVLVEFEPQRTPGLAFFGLQEELSNLLGRPVDLNTPEDLPVAFRSAVLRSAQLQYEPAATDRRSPGDH
jgi:uncharacterized protein